ncbi:MAG: hypothetical protein EWM48_06660 [Sphaerochaeta sp.]|nr:hypothetical protein [Spirochaetota bacterium]TAH57030.1 MAG: hypothetical protein EWM48_06660 [Sphaerochaeta sp.]
MPPMLMIFRLKRPERRPISLYIPLLLAYIPLLPLVLLALVSLPFLAISEKTRQYLPLVKALPSLLIATRGTRISVESNDHTIYLYIK